MSGDPLTTPPGDLPPAPPSQPLSESPVRRGQPPPEAEEVETPVEDEEEWTPRPVAYRGATSDPVFGYLIAIALSLGLTPLLPSGADLRYTLSWGVMAGFGVLSWLLGNSARIDQEAPENLSWGVVFGLIIAAPLLIVGGSTLSTTVHLLFRTLFGGQVVTLPPGTVLAFLVFVQPVAETLFFRGVLQQNRPFWLAGLLSSLWSALLFFPMLEVTRFPGVAVIIGTALLMMNMMYSYVRQRNGLAAAWLCQIVVNLILLFLPFVGGA